jgi:hypothetical protein
MDGERGSRHGEDRAIYLLDTSGRVVGWPRLSGAHDGGHTKDHRHLSGFYTPRAREAGEPESDLLHACGDLMETEGWRVREDGSLFWATVVMSPFQDQEGRLLGVVMVLAAHEARVEESGEASQPAMFPTKFDRRRR